MMKADFTSDAWQALARHMEGQLKIARERLESRDMGIEETNYMRGKIASYKELLALPKQPAALTQNVEPE